MYTTIRFVLQESGILLGGVSDCEELVGLLTGDDGGSHPVNKNHKAHPNLSHPMTRVVVPLKFDFVQV